MSNNELLDNKRCVCMCLHGCIFSLCPFVNTSHGHTHLLLGLYPCTATPSLHYTGHFLFSRTHKWKPGVSNFMSNGFPLCSIYLFTAFFPPYLFISFWFLSALSRLRSPGYIVPDKHFCSTDKSFVWRYLFCEIVLVTCSRAFWRNMIAQIQTHTHFDIRGSTAKRVNNPHSPCFPFFNSHFTAFSKSKRTFFWDIIWNPSPHTEMSFTF